MVAALPSLPAWRLPLRGGSTRLPEAIGNFCVQHALEFGTPAVRFHIVPGPAGCFRKTGTRSRCWSCRLVDTGGCRPTELLREVETILKDVTVFAQNDSAVGVLNKAGMACDGARWLQS